MLGVLIKKQLSEIFRSYLYDTRKNKARSKGSAACFSPWLTGSADR